MYATAESPHLHRLRSKAPGRPPCTPQCVINGDATSRAIEHARNASTVATVVRLVHNRDCSSTSSLKSSSSRRSPSPQSKTETVTAGAKVLEAGTPGPNMERRADASKPSAPLVYALNRVKILRLRR
ncbi:hypothetical protein HPB50_023125 [Hyalomma asiaticum]|uniref:Uncharacterized protein n=1 Tax=Hyalomma asiaticum TaxID=266040 RepID=A0ACB7TMN2_HYAAI|nr:hypothetical protein HPB50_023125 [Hyalomma asiaticum]